MAADGATEFIRLDIRDRSALVAILAHKRPAAVVHLAGRFHPRWAHHHPEVAYEVNVGGTGALLAAMRQVAFDGLFVLASDIAVFGPGLRHTLDSRARPTTTLGRVLLAREQMVDACRTAWNLDATVLRFPVLAQPNHVWDTEALADARLLGRLVYAARRNKERRPFAHHAGRQIEVLHVNDAAEAIAGAVERGRDGLDLPPVANIGSGQALSEDALIDELKTIAGRPFPTRLADLPDWRLVQSSADGSLWADVTGWTPSVSPAELLRLSWDAVSTTSE